MYMINMAKKRIVYRKSRKHSRHHSHESAVIPAVLGGTAAVLPFVSDKTMTGQSVLSDIMNNLQAYQNGYGMELNNLGMELEQATMNNLADILGLVVAGAVLSWIGKKSGMRSKTKISKKWSLI